MKKRSTLLVLLLSATLLQFCKKADDATDATDTTTSTIPFNTYVNGTLWTPKTVSVTLTYNATAKTKNLLCTATDTAGTTKIVLSLSQSVTALDSTLTVQSYTDTTQYKPMYYTIASSKAAPIGTLKGGYLILSAADATKKLLTGTFAFTATKYNYDGNGNVISVTSTGVTSGQFNNLPYTFKKQ